MIHLIHAVRVVHSAKGCRLVVWKEQQDVAKVRLFLLLLLFLPINIVLPTGCCIAGVPCCNDRCCPSSAYTCDNSSEIPQCRLIASSSSTQSESTTSSATATPSQSDPPAQSSNNAAIIGGAVGGAVALILIGLLAWWIVKKNKKPMPAASTSSRPANDTPSNAGNQPLMASTPSAYHGSNGTPITPFTQPGIPTTSGSPPITAQPSTYPAHSVMTFTTPTGGVGSSGHVSGFGYAAGAGMSGGAVPAESNDQQSYGQGGLGYVPPPPEGSTSGPVYSASMQVSQDFPGHATTSNYSPSTLPSSFSPFVPMSAMAHQGDSRPPWAQGSGIASPEPSYTGTLSPSLIHPYTDAASYSANPGSGTTCDLVDQATNNPNQGSFVPGAMSPPPGVVSPPPPFTPSPGRRMDGPSAAGDGQAPWAIPVTTQTSLGPPPNAGYGGPAGNDGQGRVVPMTAPGDRKAAFRNASRGGS